MKAGLLPEGSHVRWPLKMALIPSSLAGNCERFFLLKDLITIEFTLIILIAFTVILFTMKKIVLTRMKYQTREQTFVHTQAVTLTIRKTCMHDAHFFFSHKNTN